MPNKTLKSMAKELGVPSSRIEHLWDKAKKQTSEKFKGAHEKDFGDREWAYTMGVLKKMLGIGESADLVTRSLAGEPINELLGAVGRGVGKAVQKVGQAAGEFGSGVAQAAGSSGVVPVQQAGRLAQKVLQGGGDVVSTAGKGIQNLSTPLEDPTKKKPIQAKTVQPNDPAMGLKYGQQIQSGSFQGTLHSAALDPNTGLILITVQPGGMPSTAQEMVDRALKGENLDEFLAPLLARGAIAAQGAVRGLAAAGRVAGGTLAKVGGPLAKVGKGALVVADMADDVALAPFQKEVPGEKESEMTRAQNVVKVGKSKGEVLFSGKDEKGNVTLVTSISGMEPGKDKKTGEYLPDGEWSKLKGQPITVSDPQMFWRKWSGTIEDVTINPDHGALNLVVKPGSKKKETQTA